MAENSMPTQICVLKVDLQCCQGCAKKVNKMLQKIKGVHNINIDTEEGLVIVTGILNPALVIKAIENVGIMAELLVYEKDPVQANKKLHHCLKKMQIGEGQTGSPSNYKDRVKDHQPVPWFENSNTDNDDHDHGYAGARYMIPNMADDHLPQWPNSYSICWHHPNYGMRRVFPWPRPAVPRQNYVYPNDYPTIYNRQSPPPHYIRWTRPPLPYPFSIYEQ